MIKIKEQFIIDKKGQKTAVVIPCRDYETLMEELHDLAVIAERKQEGKYSHSDFKKKLKEDGLI